MGGLLAPLSWFAMAAVDAEAMNDCRLRLGDCDHLPDLQHELWGLDAEALARRLARRWELPDWLRAIAGYLSLSAADAVQVGADPRVFQTVQLAVLLAQTNGRHLGLPVGSDCPSLLADLALSEEDLNDIGAEWCVADSLKEEQAAHPLPEPKSLLPDLLELAVERRRLEDGPFAERLEREIDRLQHALVERRQSESERLHKQKLRALVELSAGAGHEINNPLAVISGQCQYLLRREEDPGRRDLLRIVIRQTERIHQILTDLMQFARPATPRRQSNDLKPLIAEAVARQSPPAEAQGVRLEWNEPEQPVFANVDPGMIRTAVAALLRNACDAAGQDGWVRLTIESAGGQWQIAIEDSGPGPTPAQIEHLFDPFFSGRSAGRGRGLGLSTAWRLVHENGGDVRFEPTEDRPSRFVIRIPRSEPAAEPGPSTSEYFPARKIA
jgi:signal transduction histidine kinase